MSTALTIKQRKFAEIYLQTGNKTRAAREAGYAANRAASTAHELLITKPNVRDYVQRRRAIMMERYCLQTSEVIGALVEISTASIGDVLETDGSFDIDKCRDRCVDHLIKKVKVTERYTKAGDRIVTTELEMYSRLEALNQLASILGLKQADKVNDADKAEEELRNKVLQFIEECKLRQWTTSEEEAARLLSEPIETTAVEVEDGP